MLNTAVIVGLYGLVVIELVNLNLNRLRGCTTSQINWYKTINSLWRLMVSIKSKSKLL